MKSFYRDQRALHRGVIFDLSGVDGHAFKLMKVTLLNIIQDLMMLSIIKQYRLLAYL